MPIVTYATLNPNDKGSIITLSDGDLTATAGTTNDWANSQVRANMGQSTGKWYWEAQFHTPNVHCEIGIATLAWPTGLGANTFPGCDANSYGWLPNDGTQSRFHFQNSYSTGSQVPSGYLMFALDCDAHKLWCGANGIWMSGDPAAGTSPKWSNLAAGATWYPAMAMKSNGRLSFRFGPTFMGAVPFGFHPGFHTEINLQISGVVTENGVPVSRLVRMYRRDTGALIEEKMSSAVDGSFAFAMQTEFPVYLVALDDDAGSEYNALIFDRVMPATV